MVAEKEDSSLHEISDDGERATENHEVNSKEGSSESDEKSDEEKTSESEEVSSKDDSSGQTSEEKSEEEGKFAGSHEVNSKEEEGSEKEEIADAPEDDSDQVDANGHEEQEIGEGEEFGEEDAGDDHEEETDDNELEKKTSKTGEAEGEKEKQEESLENEKITDEGEEESEEEEEEILVEKRKYNFFKEEVEEEIPTDVEEVIYKKNNLYGIIVRASSKVGIVPPAELSYPYLESERMVNAYDQMLLRLCLFGQLPSFWIRWLIEVRLPSKLQYSIESFLRLRQDFRESAEKVYEDAHEEDEEEDEEAKNRRVLDDDDEVSLAALQLKKAKNQYITELLEIQEQLDIETRNLVRQWRRYEADVPSLLPVSHSPPLRIFLRLLTRVRAQFSRRLYITPVDYDAIIDELRQTWRNEKQNSRLKDSIADKLKSMQSDYEEDCEYLDSIIKDLEEQIFKMEDHAQEEIANMMMECVNSVVSDRSFFHTQKEKVDNIMTKNESTFQKMRKENRARELVLKKRRLKVESEVDTWIQKYDTEMTLKQTEFEEMTAEYAAEIEEMEELTPLVAEMFDRYTDVALMRRARDEERIATENRLIEQTKAATQIQAFWRGYLVRRKSGKKKKGGKKGKGKKGKKRRK